MDGNTSISSFEICASRLRVGDVRWCVDADGDDAIAGGAGQILDHGVTHDRPGESFHVQLPCPFAARLECVSHRSRWWRVSAGASRPLGATPAGGTLAAESI